MKAFPAGLVPFSPQAVAGEGDGLQGRVEIEEERLRIAVDSVKALRWRTPN
jgi:hypothetical protein